MDAFPHPSETASAMDRDAVEWRQVGSFWRVVPYGAKVSEANQDEKKQKNRKIVIKAVIKFMKSDHRWVVRERLGGGGVAVGTRWGLSGWRGRQ